MLANRYENMHELERHIIHATETLKVASMTLEAMIRDHNDFTISRVGPRRDDPPKILETEENLGRSLHFYSNFFKSLQLRADAFEERLQNEIRLVSFSLVLLSCFSLTPARHLTLLQRTIAPYRKACKSSQLRN